MNGHHAEKYSQIYEYLQAPERPADAAGNFVFGRKEPLLVVKMNELSTQGLAKYFLITGGIGKDSGDLAERRISEAEYLAELVEEAGEIPSEKIHLETKATNGGENVRNGLEVIRSLDLPYQDKLVAVSHATSLRRLAATLDHESDKAGTPINHIYRIPTGYQFDPENPADQEEARAELLRLSNWPEKGWLKPQTDLPENLVDFARDIEEKSK